MSAIILFNRGQLARKLNRDTRTVKVHLENLKIEPDAISPSGIALYGEGTLHTLQAHQRTMREIFAEGRGILYGPKSTISNAS